MCLEETALERNVSLETKKGKSFLKKMEFNNTFILEFWLFYTYLTASSPPKAKECVVRMCMMVQSQEVVSVTESVPRDGDTHTSYPLGR